MTCDLLCRTRLIPGSSLFIDMHDAATEKELNRLYTIETILNITPWMLPGAAKTFTHLVGIIGYEAYNKVSLGPT